jgi:diphthamide synthase (EF-2-diphthine--ammonia ligase)
LGCMLDEKFLSALPAGVDPCGERGEFHTFVTDGPLFRSAVMIEHGAVVKKTYQFSVVTLSGTIEKKDSAFWFQDLLPRIAS